VKGFYQSRFKDPGDLTKPIILGNLELLDQAFLFNTCVTRGGALASETGQTLGQRVPWCPLEWRTDALPFVDIPFQLLVVFSFTSLSLFCPSLENRAT